MVDVSIIIVSFGTAELTLAAIQSVYEETRRSFELFVVDNNSPDGSADLIAERFPEVKLIRLDYNAGFAAANNLAAEKTTGRYLLLLNSDTVVLAGAVDTLVGFADQHPECGVYGGSTFFADGSRNPASGWNRPTVWSLFCVAAGLSRLFPRSRVFNPEALVGRRWDDPREVDIVSGCFLLASREVWECLGGFDSRFFMYGEDADFCLRGREAGFRPVIVPSARIIHYGGASESKRADKMVRLFTAKAELCRVHYGGAYARLCVAMLRLWAVARIGMFASAALFMRTAPSRKREWQKIWQQRAVWGGARGKRMSFLKSVRKYLYPIADIALTPCVYLAAILLKAIRRAGVQRLPACRWALLTVGVFPIRNHYYEPRFDYRSTANLAPRHRTVDGINWNVGGQIELLKDLAFSDELLTASPRRNGNKHLFSENGFFGAGDAEYWYQIIRCFKPRRIIEIGSGNSTIVAQEALKKNEKDTPGYSCEHVCVEPYEAPWLAQMDVTLYREKVEDIGLSLFSMLERNDILFIDSSHVIRPQGDVLFEYLELLPSLKHGVLVHVHDIFSPNDYPKRWVEDEVRFWNEQYLLEAFLSHNSSWEVIGALNYLKRNHYSRLKAVAPSLTHHSEPGSLYIRKVE